MKRLSLIRHLVESSPFCILEAERPGRPLQYCRLQREKYRPAVSGRAKKVKEETCSDTACLCEIPNAPSSIIAVFNNWSPQRQRND